MDERGIHIDDSLLHRWAIRMVPLLVKVYVLINGVPADDGEWTKRIPK